MNKGRGIAFLIVLVSSFLVAHARGASADVELRGTVRDPAHDAIAGASVTITNLETGWRRKCQTDTNGRFVLAAPPGTYRVTADLFGYVGATRDKVTLPKAGPQRLDFSLSLAGSDSAPKASHPER